MTIHTTPIIIPPLNANDSEARIPKGTTVALSDGGSATYVQAGSEIARYDAVAIRVDQTVISLTMFPKLFNSLKTVPVLTV